MAQQFIHLTHNIDSQRSTLSEFFVYLGIHVVAEVPDAASAGVKA